MLNFRKLKQDFASAVIKEGRCLHDEQRVVSAKILYLDEKTMRIGGKILGQFENHYESHIEIDRAECAAIDSDCDCPYNYDCQHLAALLFYLEAHLDEILVSYSKEADFSESTSDLEEGARSELLEKLKEAEIKEEQRHGELYQKQLLQEYVITSALLSSSPFFRPEENLTVDRAECVLIFILPELETKAIEFQIALRLPGRSKPLNIPNMREFLEVLRHEEPILLSGKRYNLSIQSFSGVQQEIVRTLRDVARVLDIASEKAQRIGQIDLETFGAILALSYEAAFLPLHGYGFKPQEEEMPLLPGLYEGSLETPLRFSPVPAAICFNLEYLGAPLSKIFLRPMLVVHEERVKLSAVRLLPCATPGMLYRSCYFHFQNEIKRYHLKNLAHISEVTVPENLFGTFVENALPELSRCASVENREAIESIVTLPYVGEVKAICNLVYLDRELEATLHFIYEDNLIPAATSQLNFQQISSFVTKSGILARNLVEEKKIIDDLFQDFQYQPEEGIYVVKSDKKIVEFMTDLIPRNQDRVSFNCPQNLLDQFIYDQTNFILHLVPTSRIDQYEIQIQVEGALKGAKIDLLWECMASKRAFIELDTLRSKGKKIETGKLSKILVLDLEKTSTLVQVFDELGVELLDDHTVVRPLWSLANIDAAHFEGLPIRFSMDEKLVEIRKQMLGEKELTFSPIPKEVQATLRSYQVEGVHWLERLRMMFLNGILADDMGLGKTLQAIVAVSQLKKGQTLIVCPTSLLYNWKEELSKFNPGIRAGIIDGLPLQRKKIIEELSSFDILITSYTLLQKDIEQYKAYPFSYLILDEAQHIKNRGTRNAKSVKMIQAEHRLILSGTPIENSLDELWSLFDFLMPSFLSSYERFVEKYVRPQGVELAKNLSYLRKKIAPFILRRMKNDVLDDLPPVAEIVYHCQLSDVQQTLYKSYVQSARDELVKLVARDGFDRVQIHVLATLTRLKQICCHPAIFAKEKAEEGDSAKYEMMRDLVSNLIENRHKTVIFSQYTRMLQIMRTDFEQQGVRFLYLDGSSKNRLEIVKQFNEDAEIPIFLVSLKAGGTGLNLVGADTVIHYDMWWNPAVESQATDRVHRLGQKRSVSSYKLITLGTIEEKIAEMQKRKKGLVKKVVSCDDEAIAKLTWEDVLELLKT